MGVDALVKKVLEESGINPERFQLKWASAAEAPRFVKLITDFTSSIKKFGPLGEAEGLDPQTVKTRITNALNLVSNRKLRVSFGNVTKNVRKEGNFTQDYINSLVNEKLAGNITTGLVEEGVLTTLKVNSPATVASLSKEAGATSEQIDKILAALAKQGKVVQNGDTWSLA